MERRRLIMDRVLLGFKRHMIPVPWPIFTRLVRKGATKAARAIGPLDVAGASSLVLEVDFGEELHVRDYATWADPILVRK